MRTLLQLAAAILLACGAFATAADDPPPLVKSVVPAAASARVRIPVAEDEKTFMQFKARIPSPKKKGDINAKVLIDSIPNPGVVELKTWQSWGFEVPANRVGVIPELIIPGAQIAPKAAKGGDVEFRVTNVKVNIVESPAGMPAVYGECDLWLSLRDLTGGADKAYEPRMYFRDRFIELTAPNAALKRLNAGAADSPDPKATGGELVPAYGQLGGPSPTFAYAAVNGFTEYKTPNGKVERANVGVSSITAYEAPGILMTLNTARGCGVKLDKMPTGDTVVTGTVSELRLGLQTGPGFKAQKDFVLKDVTVYVNDDKTLAAVWLGPRFVEKYFKDGVYGYGADGGWRLHGRVKAADLDDIKNRPPAKKP
jgi:hypothetical protein